MMKNYLCETCRGQFNWNKLLRKRCTSRWSFLYHNSEFLSTPQLLMQSKTSTHPIISDDSGETGSNFLFHASISLSAAGKFAALNAEPGFEPARYVRLTWQTQTYFLKNTQHLNTLTLCEIVTAATAWQMWRQVVWYTGKNILEGSAASIFRAEDGYSRFLQNVAPFYCTTWCHILENWKRECTIAFTQFITATNVNKTSTLKYYTYKLHAHIQPPTLQ
jgi:hypothetical protein